VAWGCQAGILRHLKIWRKADFERLEFVKENLIAELAAGVKNGEW